MQQWNSFLVSVIHTYFLLELKSLYIKNYNTVFILRDFKRGPYWDFAIYLFGQTYEMPAHVA